MWARSELQLTEPFFRPPWRGQFEDKRDALVATLFQREGVCGIGIGIPPFARPLKRTGASNEGQTAIRRRSALEGFR